MYSTHFTLMLLNKIQGNSLLKEHEQVYFLCGRVEEKKANVKRNPIFKLPQLMDGKQQGVERKICCHFGLHAKYCQKSRHSTLKSPSPQ